MYFKIIAIDGPSGVGKSTISGLIADRLGFYYVDTGAMFRCLAWNWERQGCPENEDSLLKLGNQTEILLTKELELVDCSFLSSSFDTGIIPANVPVTKASLQFLISSNVKSISEHGILF